MESQHAHYGCGFIVKQEAGVNTFSGKWEHAHQKDSNADAQRPIVSKVAVLLVDHLRSLVHRRANLVGEMVLVTVSLTKLEASQLGLSLALEHIFWFDITMPQTYKQTLEYGVVPDCSSELVRGTKLYRFCVHDEVL